MKLTPQQIEMQEAILLKIYEWCTLEDAIKKEYESIWQKFNWLYICSRTRNAWNYWTMSQDDFTEASYDDELLFDNIFISLQKILTTLNFSWYNPSYWYLQWWIYEINERTNDNETTFKIWDYVCDRKLLNDNWTDATLRDQSKETQDIIYNMLCK